MIAEESVDHGSKGALPADLLREWSRCGEKLILL